LGLQAGRVEDRYFESSLQTTQRQFNDAKYADFGAFRPGTPGDRFGGVLGALRTINGKQDFHARLVSLPQNISRMPILPHGAGLR
jgi:hypothetical protein